MGSIKNTTRTRMKIAGATVTAIFSLASVFTGTYAWFALNNNLTATGMTVKVRITGSADMNNLNLIKFDYSAETIGSMTVYDYLNPASGTVNEYYYDSHYNGGAGAFGHDVNDEFVPVDTTMNIYDPVDRIIRGGDLIGLNCNAIYEATFTSNMENSYLNLFADRLTDKVPGENQILLSDCVDFDVYYEEDLEFSEDLYSESKTYAVGDFTTYNSFIYRCSTAVTSAETFDSSKWTQVPFYSTSSTYPVDSCTIYGGAIYTNVTAVTSAESFSKAKWQPVNTYSDSSTYAVGDFVIEDGHPLICATAVTSAETFDTSKWAAILCERIYYPTYKTTTLSASEEIYYKISYLSFLESTHAHFYGSNPKPSHIEIDRNHPLSFETTTTKRKVYVNVNYAPTQADVYIREIYNTIRAIYDFVFDFQFDENRGGNS